MRKTIYQLTMLLLLTGAAVYCRAQVSATPKPAEARECLFMYEVKLIDEFIERFNDAPDSYIRQQCATQFGSDDFITRRKLLKSLFNKMQSWSADTGMFINAVTQASRPQRLSFTDSNWYARATCLFTINGSRTEVPLVLHIKTEKGTSRWMIAGVGSSKALGNTAAAKPGGSGSGPMKFIAPSAHGTSFIGLSLLMNRTMRPTDLFEPYALQTANARALVNLITQGKATFMHTRTIEYSFYGVDGWVFNVSRFKRQDINLGWLISGLQPADAAKKKDLLQRMIYAGN